MCNESEKDNNEMTMNEGHASSRMHGASMRIKKWGEAQGHTVDTDADADADAEHCCDTNLKLI